MQRPLVAVPTDSSIDHQMCERTGMAEGIDHPCLCALHSDLLDI